MKNIYKNIIYAVLIFSLLLSPFLMPNDGNQYLYTAVACCVFVALCFIFKVQSLIRTLAPVVCFSVLMPMAVLIAIARPITTSWFGAANYFFSEFTESMFLRLITPLILALIFHFGLLRLFKTGIKKQEKNSQEI